ncbi:hypothetical protein KQX54_021046 [Cotesia glomerata]|uniref:Uncharacterized protein n=1 Tax=Cotesia glomerata TaxID=32391 RepID=A0AAV7J9U6_COTGL|nr:hypothetical protein KQX54_021046 [Cotesia glomerata]
MGWRIQATYWILVNLDELLEKFFSSFAINASFSLSDDAKFYGTEPSLVQSVPTPPPADKIEPSKVSQPCAEFACRSAWTKDKARRRKL